MIKEIAISETDNNVVITHSHASLVYNKEDGVTSHSYNKNAMSEEDGEKMIKMFKEFLQLILIN